MRPTSADESAVHCSPAACFAARIGTRCYGPVAARGAALTDLGYGRRGGGARPASSSSRSQLSASLPMHVNAKETGAFFLCGGAGH